VTESPRVMVVVLQDNGFKGYPVWRRRGELKVVL